MESEASDDSFGANDDRSEEAWSDEDCRLNKNGGESQKSLEKINSGNHLHVGRVSPSPRQAAVDLKEKSEEVVPEQVHNSLGGSELDQDRDSESYEDDAPEEEIGEDEDIEEDLEREVDQVSESGMFSRAEESVALNSQKTLLK